MKAKNAKKENVFCGVIGDENDKSLFNVPTGKI
jgi:hypothetical protein